MGVSVHIIGIKPSTDEYRKKLQAYRACFAAGIDPPYELVEFFDDLSPDHVPTDGIEVTVKDAVSGDVEYGRGATIDLSKLPEGVERIRIYMS